MSTNNINELPDIPAVPAYLRLAGLEQALAIAEFSPDGVLQWANAHYWALLGGADTEVIGSHHRSFCYPALAGSDGEDAFWARLRNGEVCSGQVERIDHAGNRWLEATYIPVPDEHGTVMHIFKMAIDISARLQAEREHQESLHRLSLAADASDTAIAISDPQGNIVYVNRGFSRMLGWHLDEINRPISELLMPDAEHAAQYAYYAGLDTGESTAWEDIVVGQDQQRYWVKIVSNLVTSTAGCWQYTVTTLTDITQVKLYAALQQPTLDAMVQELPLAEILEIICLEAERIVPDMATSILEVDAAGKLHPLAAPSLPYAYSKSLDGVEVGPMVGSCGSAAWLNETVKVNDIKTDPRWSPFCHMVWPLGYTACWSTPICNSHGMVVGTFAFYFHENNRSVAERFHPLLVDACTALCALALEREHSRQRIRQLAFYDELTGLPNRNLLYAKAEQALAAMARNDQALAVLVMDMDHFKKVNDSLGRSAGDELLCRVAAKLKQGMRAMDMAGRLSGNAFVLVLPQCDAAQVQHILARIRTLLMEPVLLARSSLSVSASVGIAMFPEDGRDVGTLLHRAEMAMYQAKKAGRGQSRFFSNEINVRAQERLMFENALRDALQHNQLHLHYQPQMGLSTGDLHGVEALARWNHPAMGEIPPARFIPLAEECGLINELSRWVLHEACRQLASWRATGVPIPCIAVNLSVSNFQDVHLPSLIAHVLESNGLLPKDLIVELTESMLLDNTPGVMQVIEAIDALGVRLSLDDFGTGYSSLSYLRRLPVSGLKLDRSFVVDLEHDEAAQALSSAILEIGRSLHLHVVAEGVETPAQHHILLELGYPVAQGYLYSPPLPADQLTSWVQSPKEAIRDKHKT